jgi:H+/Cl- antiporter ClcA
MTDTAPAPTPNPAEILRSPAYVGLLVVGAVVGIPVALVAYFFLAAIAEVQEYVFTTLPDQLGFDAEPAWWPILPLTLAGLLVALAIQYLPGDSGNKPAEGFKSDGAVPPINLFGVFAASFATLSLGVVLGPEAPLIAIGSGMGVLAIRLLKRDAPDMAVMVIAGAGSFAAIATLLGSPLAGAFLLMEAAGLGAMTGVVLVPGLVAAGVGSLIFVGLDTWAGLGNFSLAISDIPTAGTPTVSQFFWAIAIGLLAAAVGTAITRSALFLQGIVERRMLVLMPVVGAGIGVASFVFVTATDKPSSNVLFSGQDQLGPLINDAAEWSVGALLLLIMCKSLAYGLALSSFRGGPTFPGMFIGAAGGMALSHLPGLPMIAGVAMGIGAMCAVMLRLPLVSVLLVVIFLQDDGLQLTPVVIVAVAVAYVASARLAPAPAPAGAAPAPAPT